MLKYSNMKISYHTLGCKLNQAETEELKNNLEQSGFLTVSEGREDIAIIRACAVTANASQTTRELIRAAKRRGAIVIASGCLENRDLKEIDFIGKNIKEIFNFITKNFSPKKTVTGKNKQKTRAFIKIQTGCNFNCAYCVIPHFRGKNRATPPPKIIARIKDVQKNGGQEIVLTGVNICQYNHQGKNLTGLLRAILKQTSIPRVRLGSLDPRLITPKLIRLYKNEPRLLPHWHLSLQSGADTVLARMNRRYTIKKYLAVVQKLRRQNPLFSLTTDIIVGFPGETEREFQETLGFIEKIGFAKIHIFPYSRRPATVADKMTGQVQDRIKTERAKILRRLSKKITNTYAKKFIGLTRPVLFEQKKSGGWFGYTPEYLPIKYNKQENLRNKIKNIKLTTKILDL